MNHKSKENTWKIAVTCNLFNTGAFTGLPLIKLSRRFDTLLKNWDIITEITDKFSVLFADTTNRNWVVMFKAKKAMNSFNSIFENQASGIPIHENTFHKKTELYISGVIN